MKQAGAQKVLSFHDFGLPSSAGTRSLAPIARSMVHHLASPAPDFVVFEMGDGIIGSYQVSTLFDDSELMGKRVCTVVCANDFMGAWGALQWMGRFDNEKPLLISGPVTDSVEGIQFIEESWGVTAANPFDSPGKICSFIDASLKSC
jgi:hypothetical protein